MRKWITLIAGVAILAGVNLTIFQRERLRASGAVVLLPLAPVDPRSLMQGDYMALNFAAAQAIDRAGGEHLPRAGCVLLAVDAKGVGTFLRLDDGKTPPAPGQMRLRYQRRDGRIQFSTNAFFFQEGDAALYADARYGEFRVDPKGTALLTGLRGAAMEPLGNALDDRP